MASKFVIVSDLDGINYYLTPDENWTNEVEKANPFRSMSSALNKIFVLEDVIGLPRVGRRDFAPIPKKKKRS